MSKKLLLLPLAMLAFSTPAAAQIAWDGPLLVPPRAGESLGIYLMELHGGGLGAMAAWRSAGWNYGLRGGIGESGDEVGVFGGIDFSGAVHRSTYEFPLDVDWVLGAGVGVADWVRVSVPLGLSAGHTFRATGADFAPWITPRVMLDAEFGRDAPPNRDDSEVGLDLAVDLGLDLRLGSGRGPTIRFGASIGDREAIALGLVF